MSLEYILLGDFLVTRLLTKLLPKTGVNSKRVMFNYQKENPHRLDASEGETSITKMISHMRYRFGNMYYFVLLFTGTRDRTGECGHLV